VDVVRQIVPVAHAHINMRGVFTFNLGRHRKSLLFVQDPTEIVIEINDRNPGYHDICIVDVATGAMRRVCEND